MGNLYCTAVKRAKELDAVLELFDQYERIEKAFSKEIENVDQKFSVGDRVRILEVIPFDEFSRDKLRGTIIEIGISPNPNEPVYFVRRDSGTTRTCRHVEMVNTEG